MGSFLDGFADSFTSTFNAFSDRKSEKERTALGYETLDEERRQAEEDERLARERLLIDQGTLDVAKSAESRAIAEAPDIKASRDAQTRLDAAEAAGKEYLNSDKGREEMRRRMESDIAFQQAQTEGQKAAARLAIADSVLKEYAATEEGRDREKALEQALIKEREGTAAQAQAQAGKLREETTTEALGNLPEVVAAQRMLDDAWGFPPGTVTYDQAKAHLDRTTTGAPSEGAIPEVGAEPTEEPTAEEPEADPDAFDEPAPGEEPDEPYVGDGPLQNAPIPAPLAPPPAEPAAPAGEVPVARTPQPRPSGADVPMVTRSSTGKTVADYDALADDEFYRLPLEEQKEYDAMKQRSYGATPGATAPVPAIAPSAAARVPQARPTPPGATGAIPTGAEMGDMGGPGTRGLTPGVEQASYRVGEAAGERAAGRVIEAQSGTRKLPLNDKTRSMMEQAAAQTGVTVKVTSGAQESSGPNRTGSHRHDSDVGAGDIQLIDNATGKPVSMKTPEGRAKMVEFMRAARDAGATGFGAGLDYMGDTTIHVGFGDPGVWGAGGKGANAPKWLKDGMSQGAGARPSTVAQGTGARPAGVARAYQLLQQNDMPQMQAAVLAGNIQQESSGDPNAFNQEEGAKGIIQWREDRLAKLEQFAADNGGDANSLDTQIQFLIQEGESLGSGQDKAAWQEFMSATTPEAANAALKKFIRYGDESAGTRLEYANNLLRSGGAEIKGEKGSAIPVQGEGGEARSRIPTPKGEVGKKIIRTNIVKGGREAGVVGAKAAIQQAGLTSPPPAVPTAERQAAQRAYVTGDPKAAKAVAKIHEVTQKALPPGAKWSEAERNLASLNFAYRHALRTKGKEAAQAIMGEMHQAYRAMNSQYVAFAQSLASNKRTDEAVKVFIKSQAYIPDGMEATASKDADGNFIISIRDMETNEIVEQVVRTPTEVTADILGWNPSTNLDKQMLRAAGKSVPSQGFEAAQAQVRQPAEGPADIPQALTREAIPTLTPIDTSDLPPEEQMTEAERDDYKALFDAENTRRTGLNKKLEPPATTPRKDVDEQLARLATVRQTGIDPLTDAPNPMLSEQVAQLDEAFGPELNNVLSKMLQFAPDATAEVAVNDLASAMTKAKADFNRMPVQVGKGDYVSPSGEGTWKFTFDSGNSYNLGEGNAKAFRNKILAYQAGVEQTAEAAIRKAAGAAVDEQAAETARENLEKKERYTPGALGSGRAGTKQGALPYGPPTRLMPGYRPSPTTY